MSRIRVKENTTTIPIDQKGKAKFSIEIESNDKDPQKQIEPVIFKIKCNLKNGVEVTPVYGFLGNKSDRQATTIGVKYTNERKNICKLRLQICWVIVNKTSEWLAQRFPKNQYPDIYRKCSEGLQQEKIMLSFKETIMEDANKTKQQQNQQAQTVEKKQFRFESKIQTEEKERMLNMLKRINQGSQKKISIPISKDHQSELLTVQKQNQQPSVHSYNLKQLLLFLIFAFLLGMSVGIKLCRLQYQSIQVTRDSDIRKISPYSDSQIRKLDDN